MKKIIILLGILMAFTSCKKEEVIIPEDKVYDYKVIISVNGNREGWHYMEYNVNGVSNQILAPQSVEFFLIKSKDKLKVYVGSQSTNAVTPDQGSFKVKIQRYETSTQLINVIDTTLYSIRNVYNTHQDSLIFIAD